MASPVSNPAGTGTCYWNINTWVRAFVNLKPLPPEKKWKAELGPGVTSEQWKRAWDDGAFGFKLEEA